MTVKTSQKCCKPAPYLVQQNSYPVSGSFSSLPSALADG